MRAKPPVWDDIKDINLIKYIVEKDLSFKEAARRLKTTNVEEVKERFKLLLKEGRRNL